MITDEVSAWEAESLVEDLSEPSGLRIDDARRSWKDAKCGFCDRSKLEGGGIIFREAQVKGIR